MNIDRKEICDFLKHGRSNCVFWTKHFKNNKAIDKFEQKLRDCRRLATNSSDLPVRLKIEDEDGVLLVYRLKVNSFTYNYLINGAYK